MRILAVITGEYGARHIANVQQFGPPEWGIEVWRAPTLYPLGNGSSASTTYEAKPVIQARPEISGTTAGYGPTVVCSSSRPVNTVPSTPSWRKCSS
jgi:hypothetical protein